MQQTEQNTRAMVYCWGEVLVIQQETSNGRVLKVFALDERQALTDAAKNGDWQKMEQIFLDLGQSLSKEEILAIAKALIEQA